MKINLRKQAGKGDDDTGKNLFKVGLWSVEPCGFELESLSR
jgi:hypothetical protein